MNAEGKINILHVPKWYPHASDEQNGLFIQKQIKSIPNAFQLVVFIQDGEVFNESRTVFNTGNLIEVRVQIPPMSFLKKPFIKAKLIEQLVDEYFQSKLDFIHLHIATPDQFFIRRLAKKRNIPYFVSEHWSGYGDGRFKNLSFVKRKMTLSTLNEAQAVFTVSHFLENQIKRFSRQLNFIRIPNIIERSENARETSNPGFHKYMMLTDLVDDIKNISGVISAFKRHHNKFKKDELVIAGDGADKSKLQKQAEGFPIQFLGRIPHDEALSLMEKVDVLLMNSRRETFSVVIGEALARGSKVIATRCGGPEEWYTKELVNFIDVDSEDQLTSAMENVRNSQLPDQNKVKILLENFSYHHVGLAIRQSYLAK